MIGLLSLVDADDPGNVDDDVSAWTPLIHNGAFKYLSLSLTLTHSLTLNTQQSAAAAATSRAGYHKAPWKRKAAVKRHLSPVHAQTLRCSLQVRAQAFRSNLPLNQSEHDTF